jgi:phage shock protein A
MSDREELFEKLYWRQDKRAEKVREYLGALHKRIEEQEAKVVDLELRFTAQETLLEQLHTRIQGDIDANQ